ncbi:MAG: LytR/AlgR family response regulator transcription factor [Marinilabilia sp.]
MKKKVLIVEDDPYIQNSVRNVIAQQFPEIDTLKTASSISEAFEIIPDCQPDLLILSTRLPDGTAFDLLRRIEMFAFKVLFLSSHEEFYRQAMDFSAVTIVNKPIDLSDLIIGIDKAFNAISENEDRRKIEVLLSNTDLPASSQTVVFPDVENGYAVPLSSILYGEAVAGGCIMHLDNETDIFIPRPLRRYEQMFADFAFFRCHPLYVVNLRKVDQMDASGPTLSLENGTELPLEARKYEQLKERCHQTGI